MFKAKIIEDVKLWQKLKVQLLIISLPMYFLIGFYSSSFFPVYITLLVVTLYFIVLFFVYKKGKIYRSLFSKKTIEVDQNNLYVFENGQKIVNYSISEIEEMTIKNVVNDDDLKEFVKNGNTNSGFIEISKKGHTERFDLLIDSHYMQVQLNKLIDQWRQSNLRIKLA